MLSPLIKMKRRPEADPSIPLPSYQTPGAAGADVSANLPEGHRETGVTIEPWKRIIIPTGFDVEIETGWEIQVRPRSGLAAKHGISIVNSPGTIDSDYRGEIGVILVNLSDEPFHVGHGDRIAQLIVSPAYQARFEECDALSETDRGQGAFGSTGKDNKRLSETSSPVLSKGQKIKHLKRGSVYEVITLEHLPVDQDFGDGMKYPLSHFQRMGAFDSHNLAPRTMVGVQISDPSSKSSLWVLYRPLGEQEPDLPELWMRRADEFEGRFVDA